MAPLLVALQRLVCGRHGRESERTDGDRLPGIQSQRPVWLAANTPGDEGTVRCGNDELQRRIGYTQRHECLGVEVVGVVVRRRDDIYKAQAFRRDHAAGHALMRLVGRRVLARQRIGEIGVEQQVVSLPLHQEAALTQPPDMQPVGFGACALDIGKEGIVGQEG